MLNLTRKMHIKAIKMRWSTGGLNYCYLLSTQDKKHSWLIDPAEPSEVLADLTTEEKKSIVAIVNTHHHYDHAGGNNSVLNQLKLTGSKVDVIAGSHNSSAATVIPRNLQEFHIGGSIRVLCIRTPCHTQDSICYYAHDKQTDDKAVFTGDTLFTAGCGRFFEGTAEEMVHSLRSKLLGCIGDENHTSTKVYPGHEYTRGNVKFARNYIFRNIGDNNAFDALEKFTAQTEETTGCFTLEDEKKYNPFLRLDDPIVLNRVGATNGDWSPVDVMAKLREMKNK